MALQVLAVVLLYCSAYQLEDELYIMYNVQTSVQTLEITIPIKHLMCKETQYKGIFSEPLLLFLTVEKKE